jgi:hypothetical protein
VPPGYSADRRCAASAFNVSCPLRWQAASRPSCRRRAYPVHCQTVRPCCEVRYAHHHSYVASEASAVRRYYAGCGYPGARRLHWRAALVAPNITFIMSLGPHVGAQHPCTCPPLAIKGRHATLQRGLTKAHSSRLRLTKADWDTLRPSLGSQSLIHHTVE